MKNVEENAELCLLIDTAMYLKDTEKIKKLKFEYNDYNIDFYIRQEQDKMNEFAEFVFNLNY